MIINDPSFVLNHLDREDKVFDEDRVHEYSDSYFYQSKFQPENENGFISSQNNLDLNSAGHQPFKNNQTDDLSPNDGKALGEVVGRGGGDQSEHFDHKIFFGIYIMFCFISLQNNFNTGVIPASLIQIESELHLNFRQQAIFGSLEYLGVSLATLIVPVVLNKYKINKIITISVLLNGLFSLSIGLSSYTLLIYIARFGQGFCAAFTCIYAPIWINHFGPREKTATWMGIMQSSGPLGVMVGYTCAALLIIITGYDKSWRVGFIILFFFSAFTAVFFSFTDNKHVDILYLEKEEKEATENLSKAVINLTPSSRRRIRGNSLVESERYIGPDQFNDTMSMVSNQSSYAQGCLEMFRQFGNNIFIYVCLGLCVLFYIVTGIQYWATEYFVKFNGASNSSAMACFSIIAITAPVIGAILGGKISDALGGYKGKNRITALKFCVSVGLAAFIFCIPIGYIVEFWQIVVLIWFLLCFGGALIPNGTGICLSCLPKKYHSTCSSLSQLIYNIGGYFMCPLVSGTIMDLFENKLQGLIWGWRSVLIMGIVGPILFGKALFNEAHNMAEEEFNIQKDIQQKKVSELAGERRTKAWSVL